MAADNSDLLPEPPPPRPDRRDAAIEAALRRFDGADEPLVPAGPASKRSHAAWGAWGRHPQLGLALATSLVVVIGLPAALIVIQEQGHGPFGVSQPPASSATHTTVKPCRTPDCIARNIVNSESLPQVPSAGPPARGDNGAVAAEPIGPDDQLAEASPPAFVPRPPAPPPPSAAPMLAKKSVAEAVADGIVVTGSRVPKSSLSENSPLSVSDSKAAGFDAIGNAQIAPDRVLRDRSYAAFLGSLQGAVRSNDRAAVMKLIAFPLRVNSNGRSRHYADARAVRADYDRIFTPRVIRAVLDQRADQLFDRDQGIMIGDGQIWFDKVCSNSACSTGPVRIKAVNP